MAGLPHPDLREHELLTLRAHAQYQGVNYDAEVRAYRLLKEHCTSEQRAQMETPPRHPQTESTIHFDVRSPVAGHIVLHSGGVYWSMHCIVPYDIHLPLGDYALTVVLALRAYHHHQNAFHALTQGRNYYWGLA